jgi:hypothetical protein
VNVTTADDAEPETAAYGETLARLRRVKAEYDRTDVVTRNHSVMPEIR